MDYEARSKKLKQIDSLREDLHQLVTNLPLEVVMFFCLDLAVKYGNDHDTGVVKRLKDHHLIAPDPGLKTLTREFQEKYYDPEREKVFAAAAENIVINAVRWSRTRALDSATSVSGLVKGSNWLDNCVEQRGWMVRRLRWWDKLSKLTDRLWLAYSPDCPL